MINHLIMSEFIEHCLRAKETDDACRDEFVSTDADGPCTTEIAEQYLPAEKTADSCRLKFIEIVPLNRDTDGPCTTEYDSGDWSAEVKQENLPVVKQEPDDVWRIVWYLHAVLIVVIA